MQVAAHHAVALDQDLARLVRRGLVARLVHDPNLASGNRKADRGGTPVLVGIRQREEGLAHAIALEDAMPGRLLETLEVVRGERRAPGGEETGPLAGAGGTLRPR